jgi:hypothetical protein
MPLNINLATLSEFSLGKVPNLLNINLVTLSDFSLGKVPNLPSEHIHPGLIVNTFLSKKFFFFLLKET